MEKILKEGKILGCKNIDKEGKISRDLFTITYENKTYHILCTFDGLKVIHKLLIENKTN